MLSEHLFHKTDLGTASDILSGVLFRRNGAWEAHLHTIDS